LGDPEKKKEVPFADGGLQSRHFFFLRCFWNPSCISSRDPEYIDSKAENKEAQKANERTG
jgi:hypothetical protein